MLGFRLWVSKNWFSIGILASIGLGFAFPSAAGLNSSGFLTDAIVVMLMLGIGFTLPGEAITRGLKNYRLHIFIQVFLFFITPAIFFAGTAFLPLSQDMRTGLIALSVLPTTVSTCTVFTRAANGNVVATMFNAALSNVLALFIAPLMLSILLSQTAGNHAISGFADIIWSLSWKMLLPLMTGQLLRLKFKHWAQEQRSHIGQLSNILILLLVLFSMAASASQPGFVENLSLMGWALAFLALSHYVLLILAVALGKLFKFSDEDLISIAYTAPQKTLALGVPLLSAYFGSDPALLAVVLLPVLFYHPWQIINSPLVKLFRFSKNRARA